jgi:FecR-like protein
MKDDYLWDGSGEPDPEIQRLESVLGRFRYKHSAPEFPARLGLWERVRFGFWLPKLVVAVSVLLIVAGGWLLTRHVTPSRGPAANAGAARREGIVQAQHAWDVTRVQGTVKVGSAEVRKTGRLGLGEWLETDVASRAQISVGTIGEVEVEPNTRVRLLETRSNQHRLALARGTIHASIWAPPRQFFVETPSAVAVDLGCAYTLHVDESGAGLLSVTFGWVGFEFGGRESFIPAGALCQTRPETGPGTPYFQDASRQFRAALDELDFAREPSEAHGKALGVVLAQARKRDALTLWHLLSRLNGPERSRVYDRLAALVPPPAGVTRDGIERGNRQMLDAWWDALGLGEANWWRLWKRDWPPQVK